MRNLRNHIISRGPPRECALSHMSVFLLGPFVSCSRRGFVKCLGAMTDAGYTRRFSLISCRRRREEGVDESRPGKACILVTALSLVSPLVDDDRGPH